MATPREVVSSSSVVSDGNGTSSDIIVISNVSNAKASSTSEKEKLVVTVEEAVSSNRTRNRGSGERVLYTLRIPRRLAYEWYQSSNCNFVMMLNESVEWLGLNEKNGALQERIRSKILAQLLQNKKGYTKGC